MVKFLAGASHACSSPVDEPSNLVGCSLVQAFNDVGVTVEGGWTGRDVDHLRVWARRRRRSVAASTGSEGSSNHLFGRAASGEIRPSGGLEILNGAGAAPPGRAGIACYPDGSELLAGTIGYSELAKWDPTRPSSVCQVLNLPTPE